MMLSPSHRYNIKPLMVSNQMSLLDYFKKHYRIIIVALLPIRHPPRVVSSTVSLWNELLSIVNDIPLRCCYSLTLTHISCNTNLWFRPTYFIVEASWTSQGFHMCVNLRWYILRSESWRQIPTILCVVRFVKGRITFIPLTGKDVALCC